MSALQRPPSMPSRYDQSGGHASQSAGSADGMNTITGTSEKVQSASTGNPAPTGDRRRPGRIENVSEALIPLLRGEQRADFEELPDEDNLGTARGIVMGILISV